MLISAAVSFAILIHFAFWESQKLDFVDKDFISWNNANNFAYTANENVSKLIDSGCFTDPLRTYRFSNMNSLKIAELIETECAVYHETKSCEDIPKVIYFILGPKFKPHHYIAIMSVFKYWNPFAIYLISDTSFPTGDNLFKKIVNEVKPGLMKCRDASAVYGNLIKEKEHKADVIRLEMLLMHGGMYVDTDVFAFKSLDELIYATIYSSVMAQEDNRGLNNGVILSKKCSPFLLNWYRQYSTFKRWKWNDHSIKLPLHLYRQNKRELLVTENFDVSWNNNSAFFRPALGQKYSEKYFCKHLYIRDTPQERLKLEDLQSEDSDYGRICRAILNGSPMP